MNKNGLVLILVLAIILILVTISAVFINVTVREVNMVRQGNDSTRAFYLAEAGIERALTELSQNQAYTGETNVSLGEGVYDVSVSPGTAPDTYDIIATGYVPDKTSTGRAERSVSATVAASASIDVSSALSTGGAVSVSGNADIDGGDVAGITGEGSIVVQGDADVDGDPPTAYGLFPTFEEIFGATEDEIKAMATIYTDPKPNVPDPADNITWIEGSASFTKSGWSGEGILVVTGSLTLTGGDFSGIIYCKGAIQIAGNVDIEGAIFAVGSVSVTGSADIEYDSEVIGNLNQVYPYTVTSWNESN